MSKKRTSTRRTKKTQDVSKDATAELIASDSPDANEFPDGYVWFACNQRWYGMYIVQAEHTVTGKSYTIEKTGTKVDIRDMESLRDLRDRVFCQIQGKHIEISPVGKTSV